MNDYYLLKNAEEYKEMNNVIVDEFFLKRDSVLYNGFWGKNGYHSLEIIFKFNDKYYKTPRYQTDVLTFNTNNIDVGFDSPKDCKYLRVFLWSKNKFKLRLGISNVLIEVI